uniref:Uncharacterized protein n=1 Tax=Paramormyrops kingsleyae TaxID=1676925 RepID=A0A3B3RW15_9TELE
MNHTLLLTLITECKKLLQEEMGSHVTEAPVNVTSVPEAEVSTKPYDNAYFYILFVMLFYSFLALTLFRSFAGHDKDKKDPYEEFGDASAWAGKYNQNSLVEKLDFEDESTP